MNSFDFVAVAYQYQIKDKKQAEKIYSQALDITRKLVGNVPQNTLEREFPKELMDNYQDLLQMNTDQNYRENVNRRVKEVEYNIYGKRNDRWRKFNVDPVSDREARDMEKSIKGIPSVTDTMILDIEADPKVWLRNYKESKTKENIMKNKTKIREYLENDMPLDELINTYDLEEEESYSQAMINPNTKDYRKKKREYATDVSGVNTGDLDGDNGYGSSYAMDGENGYGTDDNKKSIIDAETVFDDQDNLKNGEE